jgi:hypothetical protein
MNSLSNKEIAEKIKSGKPLYVSVKENYPTGKTIDIRTDKHGTYILVEYPNYTLPNNITVGLKKYYLRKFDCKFSNDPKELNNNYKPTFTKKDRKAFVKSCIPIGEGVNKDNLTIALYGIIGIQKDKNGEMLTISVKKLNSNRSVEILTYVLDQGESVVDKEDSKTTPKKSTTKKATIKKPNSDQVKEKVVKPEIDN